MTLDTYQTQLHALYRGDGNTPSDGSTSWNHRENLLAAAINIWDNQGHLWNELWTTLADASDGDKTTVAGTTTYDMPTDFRFLGSYVRTTDTDGNHTFYEIVQPQGGEIYKNTSVKKCYVTGNKSAGFKLNFLQEPSAGETINYPYYKEPTNPTTSTDVIEMSDPFFAVYFTLAKLHEQEGAGDRARAAYSIADEKLKQMKIRNMMLPHDQTNRAQDDDFRKGRGGFGVSGFWGTTRYGDSLSS